MQLVIGRNPEILGDFLSDNPARVTNIARSKTIAHANKNARKVSSGHATAGGADFPLW